LASMYSLPLTSRRTAPRPWLMTIGSLASALTNSQVWIEVAVNGTALTPRERVASVTYALTAGGMANGAITTSMLADGAVTSNKIAVGAVTTFARRPRRT